MSFNKHEGLGLKHCHGSNAFTECVNDMVNIYEYINKYNPNKKCKISIVFDDVIADIINNEKLIQYRQNCLRAEEN